MLANSFRDELGVDGGTRKRRAPLTTSGTLSLELLGSMKNSALCGVTFAFEMHSWLGGARAKNVASEGHILGGSLRDRFQKKLTARHGE